MSGAARRRRKRLNQMLVAQTDKDMRIRDGGDLIDLGTLALSALVMLTGATTAECQVRGDEFSALLTLVHEELLAGRELQNAA